VRGAVTVVRAHKGKNNGYVNLVTHVEDGTPQESASRLVSVRFGVAEREKKEKIERGMDH